MLAIEVELLTGRYAATTYNDRETAEWPPHPARWYSALVAAWAESAELDGEPDAGEAAALDAIAAWDPPQIYAPPYEEKRSTPTYFVPVNDTSVARTYAGNYEKLSEAYTAMEQATAALPTASPKDRKKHEKTIAKATKDIEKLRDTVSGFLKGSLPGDDSMGILPDLRAKQARTFPSVTPNEPRYTLVWPNQTLNSDLVAPLRHLLTKVTRVGHSQTLVRVRMVDNPPAPNWTPDPDGRVMLRWVGPGQREALVQYFDRHLATEPRIMPAVNIRYRDAGDDTVDVPATPSAFHGDWIVYERSGGPRLSITRCHDIGRTVHRALVSFAPQLPEGGVHTAVSGREADGSVTERPHVAVAALPYVGSRYADGTIMGVAVIIPHDVDPEGRQHIMRALGAWELAHDPEEREIVVNVGSAGELELRRVLGHAHRTSLRETTWTESSTAWVSVTPIALDRNPKTLGDSDPARAARGVERAIASIISACERQGLPRPESVAIQPQPNLRGSRPAAHFHSPKADTRRPRRFLVHARITFPAPVQGPLLLGAGRYSGLGLMRPVREDRAHAGAANHPASGATTQEVPS